MSVTTKQTTFAHHYIRAIRNRRKRDYATAYWLWLTSDQSTEAPESGEMLAYMAGQAVRHRLNRIHEDEVTA